MKKYWAIFKIQAKYSLVYRGKLVLWLIGWIISFLTMVFLWRSAQAKGMIAGLTPTQLSTYYFIGMLVWAVSGWYAFSWVAKLINQGEIVNFIVKPINFHWLVLASELAWHVINTGFFLGFFLVLYLIFREFLYLSLEFYQLVWFSLALGISALVTLEFNLLMSTTAFKLIRYGGVGSLYWLLLSLLGGQLLPLAFFPDQFKPVVMALPFRFMYSFPIEVYLGQLTGWAVVRSFSLGLGWIAGLFFLYQYFWRRGLENYTGFGQ